MTATVLTVTATSNHLPGFGNDRLRFGYVDQGSGAPRSSGSEFSIDAITGTLLTPQYQDSSSWYQSLFSYNPFRYALGLGGTDSAIHNTAGVVTIATPSTPGSNSTTISGLTQTSGTDITLDTSLMSGTAGTITWEGTFDFSDGTNTVSLKLTRKYTLTPGADYLKETTTITNVDTTDLATNLRFWLGTNDDYIYTADITYKIKGNVSGSSFTPVAPADSGNGYAYLLTESASGWPGSASGSDTRANAVLVGVDLPGDPTSSPSSTTLMMYSPYASSYAVMSGLGWSTSSILGTNPLSITGTDANRSIEYGDGSYALYFDLPDLGIGESVSFDSYFTVAPYNLLGSVFGSIDEQLNPSPSPINPSPSPINPSPSPINPSPSPSDDPIILDVINTIVGTNRVRKVGNGKDVLIGTDGVDYIDSKNRKDRITGGLGADQLTGGKGKDFFIYTKVEDSTPTEYDTITDFTRRDRLDLRQIDANTSLDGDQKFSFIKSQSFSGVAGQLRFSAGRLEGDVNGDSTADFVVLLENVTKLRGASILL